jgi:hypothetical protein
VPSFVPQELRSVHVHPPVGDRAGQPARPGAPDQERRRQKTGALRCQRPKFMDILFKFNILMDKTQALP